MSAARTSSTSIDCVYVRLLGEGTIVFRPTKATPIAQDTARLLTPDGGYDPEDEDWEFKPGSVVRVERRILEGAEVYVATSVVQ
jgi:hypothetical protein